MDHIIDLGGELNRELTALPKGRCHPSKSVWSSDLLTESKLNPEKLCCIWIFWYDHLYNALEDACKEDKSVNRHLSTILVQRLTSKQSGEARRYNIGDPTAKTRLSNFHLVQKF